MATKLSPATPRSKLQRGSGLEGDRTPPSAKTTSTMFGDNSPKKRTPVSRGTELNQVQEELAKIKEQLALTEKSKANLLQDLTRSKRQVEELTAKLQDATEVLKKDRMLAEEMEHASFTAAEDWQVEVEVMKEQYEAAILELEANKQTIDSLKHELRMCVEAKNEAVRLAGEAMNAAESTAKRVEDLSAEILAARKAIAFGDSALTKGDQFKSEVSCACKDMVGVAAPCVENAQEETALLLAAKEVELGNALQESMSARSELERLKKDLALAEKSQMQLMDVNSVLERLQTELRLSKEAETKSGLQLRSLSSDVGRLARELADAKEVERTLKLQLTEMNSATKQVKLQLADAKQAEEEASAAARNARATFNKVNADIERIKESESATRASLAKVSTELEEAREKLTRVALEEAVLATFLETLKTELARNQVRLATMEKKEASARLKADTISLELTKLTEEHQKEAKLLNEKIVRSKASMESLRLEFDRQKLDVAGYMERESAVNANVEALVLELKYTQDEVMELKRKEMYASERGTALSKDLENSQKELAALKEREMSMTYRLGSLMDDLEAKQLEVSELSRRVASADDKAVSLTADLENSLAELARLKEKESSMNSKAAALSVALASLSEATENKLLELKEKEKVASVKAVALHDELRRISSEFEKALTDATVAREDASKLYESLQAANSERDQARRQEQIASIEAAQSKKDLEAASADAQTANYELQKALEVVHAAEHKAHEAAHEAEAFQEKLQAAQNEVLLVKHEAEAAREQLQAASLDLQRMSKELDHERQEAQLVRQEVLALKDEVLTVKGQAKSATEEAEGAKQEVEKLRDLVEKAKSGEEEAQSARQSVESMLQDALIELAALKLRAPVQNEAKQQSKAFSDTPSDVAISQEEFTNLNSRLQDAENRLAIATTELEASIAKAEKLSKELDAIKLEKECNENAILDMRQLLAETERAKLNMEAEIQRLLDDSKQWQTAKDAIDIPLHSDMNGRSFSLDCREEKPQPDFGEEVMSSPPNINDKDGKDDLFKWEESVVNGDVDSKEEVACVLVKKEECTSVKKEGVDSKEEVACASVKKEECASVKKEESPEHDEASLKDEVASQDESPSLPMKKKKKNLLGRLGTLLDKKKHSQQQTP